MSEGGGGYLHCCQIAAVRGASTGNGHGQDITFTKEAADACTCGALAVSIADKRCWLVLQHSTGNKFQPEKGNSTMLDKRTRAILRAILVCHKPSCCAAQEGPQPAEARLRSLHQDCYATTS